MLLMPVKTSSVFKSRWKALLWAAGVLFFAYTIGGSMPQSDGNESNSEAVAASNDTVSSDDSGAPQKIPATWN